MKTLIGFLVVAGAFACLANCGDSNHARGVISSSTTVGAGGATSSGNGGMGGLSCRIDGMNCDSASDCCSDVCDVVCGGIGTSVSVGGFGGMGGSAGMGGLGGQGGNGGQGGMANPPCSPGGTPCAGFAECCSGTCTSNQCTSCSSDGEDCGNGCCVGLTCYANKCGNCKPDGQSCQQSSECCSTSCSQGLCVKLQCPPGWLWCGDYCAQWEDEQNCGACGSQCAIGDTCCQATCRDLTSDPNSCGACLNQCGSNYTCESAVCTIKPECCEQVTNSGQPDVNSSVLVANGGDAIRWDIDPSCPLLLKRVEIFTDGGGVAFLENGVSLFGSSLPINQVSQWVGFDVNPPYQLKPNPTYGIKQTAGGKPVVHISATVGGVITPHEKLSQGVWTGNVNPESLIVRLVGVCP